MEERCGNCKYRFNENICHDWKNDAGKCYRYEKKNRDLKLEEKNKLNFKFKPINL